MNREDYRHVQRAPLCWLLYALAFTFFAVSSQPAPPAIEWIFLGTGGLMVVLAASFHYLEVVDEGQRLRVRFGPLHLFQRTIEYSSISRVEIGRTSWLDGWGIHLSIRGGWVWNLWGRDCVVIHRRRGRFTVGTDQPVELAEFLTSRISQVSAT